MARLPQNVFAQAPGNTAANKTNWTQLAIDAAKGGNYETAIDLFVTAISHDRRNAGLRYNLAIAFQRNGEIDDAAVSLTEALRLKPGMAEAAHRLAAVVGQYRIDEPARLDASGLLSALFVPDVAGEPLGKMAITLLRTAGPLGDALIAGERDGWDTTATAMLANRTAPLLRDALFLKALAVHSNQDAGVEHFLAALRSALLHLPAERYSDKTVLAFAIALAAQCLNNEHVFCVGDGDQAEVLTLPGRAKLAAKLSAPAIKDLVVALMYAPPDVVLGAAPEQSLLRTMRPKSLREFLLPVIARQNAEADIKSTLSQSSALTGGTPNKVAVQYEARPYPRWTSFRRPPEGSFSKMLERFFTPARLAFTKQPFDVLIAGCGTGRHALQSAIGHGPNARVTAIDLARRSLAYAAREARERRVTNIAFTQADLLDPAAPANRFEVIECVGVLHHLPQPLEGLKALHRQLKPGGIMQIALYSAVSREELSELRLEPDFPGPECSEHDARTYRTALLDRNAETTGGELTNSPDFWSLSGFRDLVLHVSEQQFTLPEIETTLDDLGLIFRGFTLHPQIAAEFEEAHPGSSWPGKLAQWWAYEQENPRLFDGMYNFWVEKPDPSRPERP